MRDKNSKNIPLERFEEFLSDSQSFAKAFPREQTAPQRAEAFHAFAAAVDVFLPKRDTQFDVLSRTLTGKRNKTVRIFAKRLDGFEVEWVVYYYNEGRGRKCIQIRETIGSPNLAPRTNDQPPPQTKWALNRRLSEARFS